MNYENLSLAQLIAEGRAVQQKLRAEHIGTEPYQQLAGQQALISRAANGNRNQIKPRND